MSKLLLWLSLAALGILIIGTSFMPNDPMFWLASTSRFYDSLRLILSIIILLQLMTSPPRHVAFRIFAGLAAAITGVWVVQQSYEYHMPLLDTGAFLGSSITVLVTALERQFTNVVTVHKAADMN